MFINIVVKCALLLAVLMYGESQISVAAEGDGATGHEQLTSPKVMICSIIKNEDLYVDEWLQYYQFLGFDRVELYDNAHSISSHIASLSERYGGFVRVTHLPGLGKQVEAYRNCTDRHRNDNMWGAFLDLDEFIVLRKHTNIKAFLQDVAPYGGSVALGWSFMGSNNSMTRQPGPVVERFTLTSALPDKHIKTIAYLKHAKDPNVHNVVMLPGYPTVTQHGRKVSSRSPYVYNNTREIAYINHYYTKSLEEFILKRQRGWASSYKRNHLVTGQGHDAHMVIINDYNYHNRHANVVEDTFARDFYVKQCLGDAYNATST